MFFIYIKKMYKFYFIKTPRTLDWIEQLLYQIGYATNQFYLKVIRDYQIVKQTGRLSISTSVFTIFWLHRIV